jgi:phenylacetate-CoA ligase
MTAPFWQLPIRAFESGIKRRNTFRYWRELDRTQWLQREELEAIQLRALQRLVAHAAERCPYYRDTWRSLGLDTASLTALDLFRRWPVIDQHTIREHRLAMRAQVPGMRLLSKATGGSTGIPLELDLNPDSYDRRFAASFRATRGPPNAGGSSCTCGAARLATSPMETHQTSGRGLYRRRVWTASISAPTGSATVAELDRYQRTSSSPHESAVAIRTCSTSRAAAVCASIDRRRAEKLHDFRRAANRTRVPAPVFETYGCREFMLIGAECSRHAGST